jgi:hypothetical protein
VGPVLAAYDAWAPAKGPAIQLASITLDAHMALTNNAFKCKLYRPDDALSMYWMSIVFDDCAKEEAAAKRLGMAKLLSVDQQTVIRFPPRLGDFKDAATDDQHWDATRERYEAAVDAGYRPAMLELGVQLDKRGQPELGQQCRSGARPARRRHGPWRVMDV